MKKMLKLASAAVVAYLLFTPGFAAVPQMPGNAVCLCDGVVGHTTTVELCTMEITIDGDLGECINNEWPWGGQCDDKVWPCTAAITPTWSDPSCCDETAAVNLTAICNDDDEKWLCTVWWIGLVCDVSDSA